MAGLRSGSQWNSLSESWRCLIKRTFLSLRQNLWADTDGEGFFWNSKRLLWSGTQFDHKNWPIDRKRKSTQSTNLDHFGCANCLRRSWTPGWTSGGAFCFNPIQWWVNKKRQFTFTKLLAITICIVGSLKKRAAATRSPLQLFIFNFFMFNSAQKSLLRSYLTQASASEHWARRC